MVVVGEVLYVAGEECICMFHTRTLEDLGTITDGLEGLQV